MSGDPVGRRCLFVCHFDTPVLTTMLPLAVRARDTYCVVPLFLLYGDQRRSGPALADAGFEVRTLDPDLLNPTESTAGVGLTKAIPLIRRMWDIFKVLGRRRQYARSLIREIKPVAVFETFESPTIETFLNEECSKAGVPTVLVQWALLATAGMHQRRKTQAYERHTGASGLRLGLLMVRRSLGLLITRCIFAARRVRYVSHLGAGNASAIAVIGDAQHALLVRQGVPESKIKITGHPEDDYLLECRLQVSLPEARREVLLNLGVEVESDQRVVVYVREAMAYFNMVDAPTDREAMRRILKTLDRPGWVTIMKLHPRDERDYYDWVPGEFPNVVIVHECDLVLLMTASDAFVSQGSSTTRWAKVLGMPAAVADFSNLELSAIISETTGVPLVDDEDSLGRVLFDDKIRDEPKSDRPGDDSVTASDRILELALGPRSRSEIR